MAGNVTRVLASDLDQLSSYLNSNFKYDTGPYQDYDFEIPARRYLAKLDYNLNDRNKISVRYMQLDSKHRPLVSNSSSLGFGTRRTQHHRPQLRELELRDPREHQVGRRRVELDPRQQQGQLADRRLHLPRREPRVGRRVLPDGRHPQRGHGLHHVRLRAVHAEQRAAVQDLPDPGQLHLEPRQPRVHVRRDRAALQVGERLLPRLAERLRLQLARRLLHRRERLPGQPEPHDLARDPPPASRCAGTTSPGRRSPSSRSTVWYTGLYAQDEWQATPRVKVTYGLRMDVPVLRRHGLPERERRRPHVPRRGRQPRPVPDGEAPGRQHPLVAARGLQLGRDRQPHDPGARRHGRLHGPAGLRLDLQPGRQHGRPHRLRAARQHEGRGRGTRTRTPTSPRT